MGLVTRTAVALVALGVLVGVAGCAGAEELGPPGSLAGSGIFQPWWISVTIDEGSGAELVGQSQLDRVDDSSTPSYEPGESPTAVVPVPSSTPLPAVPRVVTVAGAYFEFDSPDLVTAPADLLEVLPCFTGEIEIAGHTDSTGSPVRNAALSLDRAQAVAAYVVEVGEFDPKRLTVIGKADSEPAVIEATADDVEEARARNRRVELVGLADHDCLTEAMSS